MLRGEFSHGSFELVLHAVHGIVTRFTSSVTTFFQNFVGKCYNILQWVHESLLNSWWPHHAVCAIWTHSWMTFFSGLLKIVLTKGSTIAVSFTGEKVMKLCPGNVANVRGSVATWLTDGKRRFSKNITSTVKAWLTAQVLSIGSPFSCTSSGTES